MQSKLMVLVFLLVLGAASMAAAQPEPVKVPVPSGWTAFDEEYRYDRENLWEYINGAAELFLSYGFRELIVLDVEKGDSGLTVCVYDMGTPLDAFGIFDREKPADGKHLSDIGALAILQPPYRGLLLKDRFYVKVEIGGGAVSEEELSSILGEVASGLPGVDGLPAQLEALPETDRVPGSVAFAGRDFLGVADLSNCLHAKYLKADGTQYQLFAMKPSKSFLKGASKKWVVEERADGGLLIWRKIPYSGAVVLLGDETQLLGAAGFDDYKEATALLESLQP